MLCFAKLKRDDWRLHRIFTRRMISTRRLGDRRSSVSLVFAGSSFLLLDPCEGELGATLVGSFRLIRSLCTRGWPAKGLFQRTVRAITTLSLELYCTRQPVLLFYRSVSAAVPLQLQTWPLSKISDAHHSFNIIKRKKCCAGQRVYPTGNFILGAPQRRPQ